MTPKDKAKELYNNYLSNVVTNYTNMNEVSAKQCSLICVQEIINANPQSNPFNTKPTYSTMAYWNAVKKEIENL